MKTLLSATKPRKKCAICKYWNGEKPEIPTLGVYFIEKGNNGCCVHKNSPNYNTICGAMCDCENFELDANYTEEAIINKFKNIKKLHIPKQIAAIPYKFYRYYKNLEEVVVEEDNKNLCSVDGVMFTKDKTTLLLYPYKKKNKVFHVPEEMTAIYKFGLAFGTEIDVLDIGKNTHIDIDVFKMCLIKSYLADVNNEKYATHCGVLYNKDMKTARSYPNAKEDYFFEIPKETESFLAVGFSCNGYLRELSTHKNCILSLSDIMPSNINTIIIKGEENTKEGSEHKLIICENIYDVDEGGCEILVYNFWDDIDDDIILQFDTIRIVREDECDDGFIYENNDDYEYWFDSLTR